MKEFLLMKLPILSCFFLQVWLHFNVPVLDLISQAMVDIKVIVSPPPHLKLLLKHEMFVQFN